MKDIYKFLMKNKTFIHSYSTPIFFIKYVITQLTRVLVFKWNYSVYQTFIFVLKYIDFYVLREAGNKR